MKKTTIFVLLILNLFIIGCTEPASGKSYKKNWYDKIVNGFDVADTYETSRKDTRYTYQEAYNLCTNLTLNGYSDWRLPTKRESKYFGYKNLKYPVKDMYHWTGTHFNGSIDVFSYYYSDFYKELSWQGSSIKNHNELQAARCVRGPIYGKPIAIPEHAKKMRVEYAEYEERVKAKKRARQQNYSSPSYGSSKYRCTFHCVGRWDMWRGGEYNVKTTATTQMGAEKYIKQKYKSTCAQYPFHKGGGGSASVGKMNCSTY